MTQIHTSFIDGKASDPGEDILTPVDPSTGKVYAQVASASKEDVDAAVRSADRAFKEWQALKPAERGRILYRVSQAILEHVDELAELETQGIGQALTVSRTDARSTARYFEFFAGAADKQMGEVIPVSDEFHTYTERVPFGVVGLILPWNAPLTQAARAIAPALAAGNSVVVKPASDTPLTALAMARIAVEAGLPSGLFNVVVGRGSSTGMAIVDHPLVRKVAFTGSVETGVALMKRAADRVIPLSLELGGKSPNIIFDDADLDAAVAGAWKGFTVKCGQTCTAGSRLLVQRTVHDEVVKRLVALAGTKRIGPGADEPDMGPLANKSQLEQVLRYIEIGKQEGAEVAFGGGKPADDRLAEGFFVEPTVFTGVDNRMRIAQEEIFGPVLAVIAFDTEEEAVRIANDTEFGLAAGVWTENLGKAHRMSSRINAGQVYVNEYFAGGEEAPFGGFKASGFGREKGLESLKTYSAVKTTIMRVQPAPSARG